MPTIHVLFVVEQYGIDEDGHYSDNGRTVKAFESLGGAIAYCNNPPMDLKTSFLAVRSLENGEKPISMRKYQPLALFGILADNTIQYVEDAEVEKRVQRLANDLRQTDEKGYTVLHKLNRITVDHGLLRYQ
jgi:hypothetical protein